MQILIRDVPDEVAQKLDKIAKEKGFSSRQQLVAEILARYCEVADEAFGDVIPIVTRSLIDRELERLTEKSDMVLQAAENILYKLLIAAQKIDTYVTNDYKEWS